MNRSNARAHTSGDVCRYPNKQTKRRWGGNANARKPSVEDVAIWESNLEVEERIRDELSLPKPELSARLNRRRQAECNEANKVTV